MPFAVPSAVRPLTEDEFRDLDFSVMEHVFACQNDLGRKCDEWVYRNDLAARLASAGFEVRTEMEVLVTHLDFQKEYRIDLIVGEGCVYELKAAAALCREHEAQLMNYLFILGVSRGKLVNFHSASVESRFVNAVVTSKAQRSFHVACDRWQERGSAGRTLHETLHALCSDWGVFLAGDLYREALIHFLGGEHLVLRPVPLSRNGIPLGTQKFALLEENVAFHVTTANTGLKHIEQDLRRLLTLSPLDAIQWINFNRHTIELVTLPR